MRPKVLVSRKVFDEALALPTAEAATLALRTQQVIASESGVARTHAVALAVAPDDTLRRLCREGLLDAERGRLEGFVELRPAHEHLGEAVQRQAPFCEHPLLDGREWNEFPK